MKRFLLPLLLLLPSLVFAQGGKLTQNPWVSNRQGFPAGGTSIAVCQPLATTAASVTSNLAVFTMTSNPITAGFVNGMTVQVAGFTAGDTYLNAGTLANGVLTNGLTILAVTTTTVTVSLTHANASAGTNGTLLQFGNSVTSCAGLSTVYTDASLVTTTANPLTADGLGNYDGGVVPGVYYVQYYGSGITTTVRQITVDCVVGMVASCGPGGGGGSIGGTCAANQVAVGSGVNTISCSNALTFLGNILSIGNSTNFIQTIPASGNFNIYFNDGTNNGTLCIGSNSVCGFTMQRVANVFSTAINASASGGGTFNFANGAMSIGGATSGTLTLGVAAIAGSPSRFNFPTLTGTNGQCLITDGGSPQQGSWAPCAAGGTAFPVTVTGGISGGIPCFTSTTNEASSASLVANGIVIGGGPGVCPSTVTGLPNGTTATTQSLSDNTTKVATDAFVIANSITNPMTTVGDTLYENSGPAPTRLPAFTGPTGVNGFLCSPGGGAAAPVWCWPGGQGRSNAAASDAVAAADRDTCLLETNGGAVAISLPQAGTTNFNNNFKFCIKDATTTISTITPAAGQIAGNNGTFAATLVVPPSSTTYCYSWDNANYQCAVIGTGYVLNILQTGAKCDGTTDDTTIINAAYATLAGTYGAKVVWPTNKRCVLSNTITVQNVRGATIEGGGVLWKGGAGNPVFLYSTDESVLTESFWITSASGAFPIGTAFQIQEDTGAGFGVSEFNQFFNNSIDCSGLGGTCAYGFAMVDGAVVNGNNDGMQFYGNTVYGYGTACFYIANTQYGTVTFTGNNCAGFNVGAEAVLDSPGAPFTWTGGSVSGNTVADFYLSGFAGAVLIQGVHSEQSNRFLEVTFTGASQPVTLIDDHFFTSAHTNADKACIEYQPAGPLNVIGGMYGLGGQAICRIYWNGGGGQATIFGSIIGVDSSSNSSNATNLLKFAPSTLINNVYVAGNNYLDAGGAPVSPTTPDLAAVNTSQAQTANTTDALFGSLQSNSTSACETTYAVTTLSTIATTTDTGLNCLPINAIIDAVVYRVTVTITTAVTFQIGDATISGRFSGALSATPCGASGGLTAGSTGVCFVQADQTGTSGPRQTAAAKVRVTTNANAGAGKIRLIVYYHTWTAPSA
jgi:hypothetical protein